MICGGRGGAPCLRAAALSSLPACAPSPLAARNLPRSSFAPAARARTCALTLCALRLARDVRGFLFGRPAARSPLSSLLACGAPPPLFPPLGGRAPLRSRSPRHAIPSPRGSRSSAVALAPPRSPPLAVRRAPIMSRLLIADGHAQSACETMRNVPIIV